MIERIDALRDAANANDTSIRLIPDALGKIDVSLKRDGDTVAVHFTAQHAETRQLLADAAPKLAELAEARGLKLAQGGADTASQQQQRQQPAAPAAAAQRRARTDDTESTDTRIA
ncbi:flagellar hook-length control protein FliK [Sphingomonas sp. SUN019]|nr:flagellar hook-length control protein FliK [Sphingomonas sp. SUN019]